MTDLAVTYWGSGSRSVLLLHGLSSNAAGWWRLGPDLAAAGFEVTAPDLRGHGASPEGDDYRLASYTEDVLALRSGWDVVLGHSLGGTVALMAAAANPGWAGSLILEDPALALPDADTALEWLMAPFDGPMTAESVAVESPRWHPNDCRHKSDALQASGPEVVRRTVTDNPDWDVTSLVGDLTCRTLLIGADPANDAILPPALGEATSRRNPAVDYTMIPGSGHSIHRDSYESFWEALLAALGERMANSA